MNIKQVKEDLTALFDSHSITGANSNAEKDIFTVEDMVNLVAMYIDGKFVDSKKPKWNVLMKSEIAKYKNEGSQHDDFPAKLAKRKQDTVSVDDIPIPPQGH